MAILAIEDPTYQPAMRIITAITNAQVASVTTSFDHDYLDGTVVRFVIPRHFGMQQIHEMVASITITGSTTFMVPIDSSAFDAFSTPGSFPFDLQFAQVIPIGEINSTLEAATRNVLGD